MPFKLQSHAQCAIIEDSIWRPGGPALTPATDPCAHEWEPHLWEAATEYCPYCGATRPSETEEEAKR